MLPKKGILIAFGELFLKSEGVRKIFQRKLLENLSLALKKGGFDFKIYSFHERIFIESGKGKEASKIIKNIPGIAWFSETLFFEKVNSKEFSDFLAKNYRKWIKKGETFAIRLKREKEIKESSEKIITQLAKPIKEKVDLEKPKREIFVEARKFGWFLYFKKKKGIGGLPVSSGGKVLALISGGIDSPVASFLMAKRGAENIWLHFHSFPLVSKKSIEKVKKLAEIFLNFQPYLKIYFIPFSQAQIEVKLKIPSKYRILIYRRLMLKIAQNFAKKEDCQAIVTGESLGQVSSQTLDNLRIIEDGIKIPIFRPLIGFDKNEIINLAKKIKTFEISILPQEDCCTLFVSKHATAKGNLKKVKEEEKKLDVEELIKEAIKKAKVERIKGLAQEHKP